MLVAPRAAGASAMVGRGYVCFGRGFVNLGRGSVYFGRGSVHFGRGSVHLGDIMCNSSPSFLTEG